MGRHSSTHFRLLFSLYCSCLPSPQAWCVTTVSISFMTLGLLSTVCSSSHSWRSCSLEAPSPKEVLPQPPLSFPLGSRLHQGQWAGTPSTPNPRALQEYPSFHLSHLPSIPFKAQVSSSSCSLVQTLTTHLVYRKLS